MNLKFWVDYALNTVGPPVKRMYKRTTTTAGGNDLLGIYPVNSTTVVDTILAPQPYFAQLAEKASVLSTSGLVLEASDYEVILSANSITIGELETASLTFVLKAADGTGTVEEFRMLGYEPYQFQGAYVGYCMYMRRKTTN
jgi:hypothetical protein